MISVSANSYRMNQRRNAGTFQRNESMKKSLKNEWTLGFLGGMENYTIPHLESQNLRQLYLS